MESLPGWKVCNSVEMTVPVVSRPSTHISSVSCALEEVTDLKKPMSSSVWLLMETLSTICPLELMTVTTPLSGSPTNAATYSSPALANWMVSVILLL